MGEVRAGATITQNAVFTISTGQCDTLGRKEKKRMRTSQAFPGF